MLVCCGGIDGKIHLDFTDKHARADCFYVFYAKIFEISSMGHLSKVQNSSAGKTRIGRVDVREVWLQGRQIWSGLRAIVIGDDFWLRGLAFEIMCEVINGGTL